MKLIKLKEGHYIIVDDSEIKEGDFCYDPEGDPGHNNIKCIVKCLRTNPDSYWNKYSKKITHSTVPIEKSEESQPCWGNWADLCYKKTKPLSIKEVKELLNEVNVEKKAEEFIGCKYDDIEDSIDQIGYDSFIRAYNQALEDNKEKTYTKEDLEKAIEIAQTTSYVSTQLFSGHSSVKHNFKPEEIIQSLKPKTEWEVEFIDGKLKLKS